MNMSNSGFEFYLERRVVVARVDETRSLHARSSARDNEFGIKGKSCTG